MFKVFVSFKDHAFGVESRKDVDLSPADVADELEEICVRIRRTLEKGAPAAASDPHAADTGKLTTREKESSCSVSPTQAHHKP